MERIDSNSRKHNLSVEDLLGDYEHVKITKLSYKIIYLKFNNTFAIGFYDIDGIQKYFRKDFKNKFLEIENNNIYKRTYDDVIYTIDENSIKIENSNKSKIMIFREKICYILLNINVNDMCNFYNYNKINDSIYLYRLFNNMLKYFNIIIKDCDCICCEDCGNVYDGNAQCDHKDNKGKKYIGYCSNCDKYTNFYC